MTRRDHYSVLIVKSDGSSLLRLGVSRRVLLVGAVALALAASVLGVLTGDYLQLRRLRADAPRDPGELAHTRAVMDAVTHRISELGRETDAWREIHTRIWAALGPDAALPSLPETGIGGGAEVAASSPSTALDRLTQRVMDEGANLRSLEGFMARAGRLIATLPSRWPVRGKVNSEFGARLSPWSPTREFHSGMDIGAAPGTPVRAPAPGVVAFAGAHPEYGLTVVIDHGREIRSVYGHLSQIARREGEPLALGALLGFTGNSGRSSGPHLHYEILVHGRPVNPRQYLWD